MSTVKCTNIEALTGGGAPDNLLPITCSAWVNFDGTGVVAIRDSYNVGSITDNGVGDYTANFAVALANANYSANPYTSIYIATLIDTVPNVASVRFGCYFPNDTAGGRAFIDRTNVGVQVFGGQ